MLTTLLLFDIDGTLIVGTQAGQKAYVMAMRSCLGVHVSMDGITTSGKTDLMIFRELLDRQGLRSDHATMTALLAAYLRHLEETVRLDPGQVGPGVRELLDTLSHATNVWLTLATGNLEEAAWIKLAAHGLDRYFETGGFGSDATGRDAVVAAGIARARAHYGVSFRRIVVVGDTPYDIAGARANNVHSIGVATGPFNAEALLAAGATLVIPDLRPTGALIRTLESLPPTDRTRADV